MTVSPGDRSSIWIIPVSFLIILIFPVDSRPDGPASRGAVHTSVKPRDVLLRIRSFYLHFWPQARSLGGPVTHDRRRRRRLIRTFEPKLNRVNKLSQRLSRTGRKKANSLSSLVNLLNRLYRRSLSLEKDRGRRSDRDLHRNVRQRLLRGKVTVSVLRDVFLSRLVRTLRTHGLAPVDRTFRRVRESLETFRRKLLIFWTRTFAEPFRREQERNRIQKLNSFRSRLASMQERVHRVLWLWRNRDGFRSGPEQDRFQTGRKLQEDIADLLDRFDQLVDGAGKQFRRREGGPTDVLQTYVKQGLQGALRSLHRDLRSLRRRRVDARFDCAGSGLQPGKQSCSEESVPVRGDRKSTGSWRHIVHELNADLERSMLIGTSVLNRRAIREMLDQLQWVGRLIRHMDRLRKTIRNSHTGTGGRPLRPDQFEKLRARWKQLSDMIQQWSSSYRKPDEHE